MTKFSHIADCHVGGWRDNRMKELSIEAFNIAIDTSIKEKVDFVVISGDLFNSAIPDLNSIRDVFSTLYKLKKNKIPLYFIAGSHDYSPTGNSFLEVIEEINLGTNVFIPKINNNMLELKFITDKKTNTKLTGIIGNKGELDTEKYKILNYKKIESEPGKKIFLFHASIKEMLNNKVFGSSINMLPANFDYYAGGHIHIVKEYKDPNHKLVVYPGPLFPNSFNEFEELKHGGFYIVDLEKNNIKRKNIILKDVLLIKINANEINEEELNKKLNEKIQTDLRDKIVLIRLHGKLKTDAFSFDMTNIIKEIYKKGAFFVMKNTSKLQTNSKTTTNTNIQDEEEIIKEFATKSSQIKNSEKIIKELIQYAEIEKLEGERVYQFESRVINSIESITNKMEFKNE